MIFDHCSMTDREETGRFLGEADRMYCRNCGKELKPDAKFCENCGAEVPVQAVPETAEAIPEKSKSGFTVKSDLLDAMKKKDGKDRILMTFLAVFFGAFGVHNFVMGYKGKAIAQLLITLLSFLTLLPVTQIWGLVEGILILRRKITVDAKGVPLIN